MSQVDATLDEIAQSLRNMATGHFITFEGGDGSGKSTQVARLASELQARGANVIATREPGGTALGVQLRAHIQDGPEDVDPRTEALLYAADRAYHAATVLRPALEQGITVLEDRYTDSSVAYQGAARQLGPDEIRGLSDWATQNLQPDLTLLFDVSAEEGLRRVRVAREGLDRLERAGLAFHERVRKQYLQIADQFPERVVVIDGARPIPEVFRATADALHRYLESR